MAARIGVLTVELHIGGCRSLKEKRQVMQSLITRLRNDFNLSVAEVDHHTCINARASRLHAWAIRPISLIACWTPCWNAWKTKGVSCYWKAI